MVLVFYTLYNHISLLQTKFSDREGHETRRVGLEAMPLNQHVEGGHSKREARLKIRPAPMHDLFEMADERQTLEHCLDEHPVLPLTTLTQFEIRGIPLRGMEAGVAQDDHPPIDLLNQPLKGVIRDIGRGTRPPHDQPPLIEQQTEFAPDNPAVIREAFTPDLLGTPAFTNHRWIVGGKLCLLQSSGDSRGLYARSAGDSGLHAWGEGRSPQQIGRKGLSNHRWIAADRVCPRQSSGDS